MRVYLAGPMRGLPGWNFTAFDNARKAWTAAGHTVLCPAAISRSLPWGQTDLNVREHLLHVIQVDLACIYAAEAIALLPGWQSSRGVAVELALAQFLGLPVYDAIAMKQVHPPLTPWVNTVMMPPDYTPPRSACVTCGGEKEIALICNNTLRAVPCPKCNPCQHKLGYDAAGECRVCCQGEKIDAPGVGHSY
jgi:hypothetical protein